MRRYVWRDLVHNPRRTLASLIGVTLGVGLFAGVLFFMDASRATMTTRAVAPVALDIQRVLATTPGGGLRLTEEPSASAGLGAGQQATIILSVTNDGASTENEVVVSDVPPPPLTYVGGTTQVDGRAIPDVGGESPLSHGLAGFGMNIGRLSPGATVSISYAVRATQAVGDVRSLPLAGSVSSREQAVPSPANAAAALTLEDLRRRVEAIPGVAAADGLGFVDLPPGALAAGRSDVAGPVRVFAFDERYQAHYPSIRMVDGGFRPGSVLLSAEAAGALAVRPGDTVELNVPGRRAPVSLPVSGVVDLARAQPLFASRVSTKLERFLYVPDAAVVTPATFSDQIVPGYARAQASFGSVVKTFPVQELDVQVDRSWLASDPGVALEQTKRISQAIAQISPGQDYLIDNISNALAVARDDAAVGTRMFFFLGLPGILLAAFLAGYTGSILAAAQRRERAILRVRGANRRDLRRIAVSKSLVFAGAGTVLGIALGAASVVVILGGTPFFRAAPAALIVSGLSAAGVGAVITGLALYVQDRRSVSREVGVERREMPAVQAPVWWRIRLDLVLLTAAGIAELVAVRAGDLNPPSGSVYSGIAISLPSRLMVAPLIAWVGGVLLCVRLIVAMASKLPAPASPRFGSVIGGIARRSLRRRPWVPATAIIGLGLVVGLGVDLTIFTATYDAAKLADAKLVVGSELRITPSVLSPGPHPRSYASHLTVAGVAEVSPAAFGLENSVSIGPYNQQVTNLAAIDPASFARVAPLADQLFVGRSAADSIAALGADPRGVLVDAETADSLQVAPGDTVTIILAPGTKGEIRETFHVTGLFSRFPGFPEGANLVVNLDRFQEVTGSRHIDFFLADTADDSQAGLDRAVAALQSGPGALDPLHIDTVATALDKDQSSLTALNLNGLVELDSLFVSLISVAIMAIFAFGLILQRRREYVTLRAQGLRTPELRALVLAEAATVAFCGLAAGLAVGSGVAFLLVHVLRALFVLDPTVTFPVGRIAMLTALVLGATLVSGLAAAEILRRLKPTEILREE